MNALDAMTTSTVVLDTWLGHELYFPFLDTVCTDMLHVLLTLHFDWILLAFSVRRLDDVLSVQSSPDGLPSPSRQISEADMGESFDEGRPIQGTQTLGEWLTDEDNALFAWCDDQVRSSAPAPETLPVSPPVKTFKWGTCKRCGKAMKPTVRKTGALKGEYVLRCNDWRRFEDSKRTCWHVEKYQGDIHDLPYFVRQLRKSMCEDLVWHFSSSASSSKPMVEK